MNKRTIQIDVIGPIEETELMKCKLYVECHDMTMKS